MAKGRKKQARRKAARTAAGGSGAPAGDPAPASEAVIEAKAEDASPGKPGPAGGAGNPKGGSGGGRADAAPQRPAPPGASRRPGVLVLAPWFAAGIALVAAVYFGSALVHEQAETRSLLEENTALSQRVDALEGRLSRIEGGNHPGRIADMAARIGKLEQDLAGLGDRIDGAVAQVAAAGPGTSETEAEILARIDRIEQDLGKLQLRPGTSQPGRGGLQEEAAETSAPEESEPWWGFLGRLLKISRVDGE